MGSILYLFSDEEFDVADKTIEAYRRAWRDIVHPFDRLYVARLAIGVIGIALYLLLGLLSLIALVYYRPSLTIMAIAVIGLSAALAVINSYIRTMILLSAIKPTEEAIDGKPVSDWREHMRKNFWRFSTIAVYRIAYAGLIAGPSSLIIAASVISGVSLSQY